MQNDNLIIDGTNIEFRIFYIARKMKSNEGITNFSDMKTNHIYRFLQTFISLVEKFEPTNVYSAWDKKLTWPSTNFRKDIMVDQYKAGRLKPDDIQDMYDQEIKLIEILESLGVKNIFPNVLEADDVCAWLTTVLPGKTIVVSVDQDLLQLVSPSVSIYNLKELITYDNFEEKKNIEPSSYKLFKAIKGDISDNITGLKGYGEKKARELAKNWNNADITEEYKLIVERNLKLIDLHYGFNFQEGEKKKYEDQLNYVKNVKGDLSKFTSLCGNHGFTPIIDNINRWRHFIKRNQLTDFINNLS